MENFQIRFLWSTLYMFAAGKCNNLYFDESSKAETSLKNYIELCLKLKLFKF